MNVIDAITSNLAVRDFRPEIISNEHLTKILEAARVTQSAKNLQPWIFIIIEDRKTLDNLAELMKGDIDEEIMKRTPMAVAIIGDLSSEFWLFDLGRVAQSMTLAAWELGIGSCIVSGPEPPDRESYRLKAGKLLGVPEGLKFQELIILGYPRTERMARHKNRKTLDSIVFREHFQIR